MNSVYWYNLLINESIYEKILLLNYDKIYKFFYIRTKTKEMVITRA